MKNPKAALLYLVSFAAGLILFGIAHEYATEERGYIAYGGEVFLLLLPFFTYVIRSCVGDIIKSLKGDGDMSIVAVQFQSKNNPDRFGGREYTYFSNVKLTVGDVILAPTKKGKGVVRVCRTDCAESEISESVRPFMRTIEEKLRPEDVGVGV